MSMFPKNLQKRLFALHCNKIIVNYCMNTITPNDRTEYPVRMSVTWVYLTYDLATE